MITTTFLSAVFIRVASSILTAALIAMAISLFKPGHVPHSAAVDAAN